MSTEVIRGTLIQRVPRWAVALVCLNALACMRKLDVSKLKCVGEATCPNGYSCSPLPGQSYGACVPDQGTPDADHPDQALPQPSDGPAGLDGPGGRTIEGPSGSDGATRMDSGQGGTDGALIEAGAGGAPAAGGAGGMGGGGGTVQPDAPAATGGVTASGGALASGGTTASGGVTATGGATQSDGATASGGARTDGGLDAPLALPNGSACGSKDECASAICADGVCCQSACSGQCQVCNAAGACVRVTSGAPRAGHGACAATDPMCAGTCDGTSDACVYKGAETVCTAATCADVATLNNARVCNGQGACAAAQQVNCSNSGQYCRGNTCVATLGDGNPCTSSVQCTNANCTGGTCCGTGQTGCSGTCANLNTSNANCGSCGHGCSGGQTCCSGLCTDLNNDNASCGSCGRSCGGQTCLTGICCDASNVNCGGSCCDTNHTCTGSSCTCQGYSFACGGCSAWNFESNGIEGWVKTPASLGGDHVASNGVGTFSVSTGRYIQGTHSLAVSLATTTTNNIAAFSVPLCPATGAAVSVPANITLTASLFFTGDAMPSFSLLYAELYGPSGFASAQDPTLGTSIPGTTWITFQGTFSTAVTASHVGFYFLPGNAWSGTVYVDQVKLSM